MTVHLVNPESLASLLRAPVQIHDVSVRQLTRVHGDVHVVFRASFRLTAGTCTAVLGPNGAGKSSLIQMLALLARPSAGTIAMGNVRNSWDERLSLRPAIGLVSHDALVHQELTGRENLAYIASLYGLADSAERVGQWLDRVGLAEACDRPVATYSRGMRQRLSIARALLTDPSLVVFDEPLTGLDRAGQGFFWGVVRALRAAGRMVVVVTHDFDVPDGVVDRALVLVRGRVRYDGPVHGSLLSLYNSALADGSGGGA
jgi:ABC-type multidrug transport system ATPase subunit